MKELLLPAVSLLPSIAIIIILAYFYSRKRISELLVMLIAYIVITGVTAFSIYGVQYFYARGKSAEEIQRVYTIIGIISLVAQALLAVGLSLVLSKYPDAKDDPYSSTF